jgi:prophage DNA circulation protein
MGSINSIFNALTSPVRDIIRAVSDISNQAVGIVNLVNHTIQGLTGQVTSIDNQVRIALGNLKNAAGVISSAPKTISQSIGELVNSGRLPITTGYLQNRPMASLSSSGSSPSKLALLNSGKKYTAQAGASL